MVASRSVAGSCARSVTVSKTTSGSTVQRGTGCAEPTRRHRHQQRAVRDRVVRHPRRPAGRGVPRRTSTSKFHPQFDEWVVERHNHRRLVEEVNGEYVAKWEGENAEGLRGAYDPEVRDKELDADGIAGEVIFADGDSVTGQESPPFGAGLAAGPDHRPRPGLRRRPGPQPLARRVLRHQPGAPRRRGAGAGHPRRRRVGARDRVARRQPRHQGRS